MKKCPYCTEEIQDDAIVCRFCGRYLSPTQVTVGETKKSITSISGLLKKFALGIIFICFFCVVILSVSLLLGEAQKPKPIETKETISNIILSTSTATDLPITDTPRPSPSSTNTLTITPSSTHTHTLEPATQTAIAVNQAATQKAIQLTNISEARFSQATQTAAIIARNTTGTAVQASRRATGTAEAKSDYATQIAEYTRINPSELVTYPNNHIAELVVIRGKVFNVISNTDFQLWIDGLSGEAIYVSMVNAYSDIYENDYVTVYGIVAGEACGTNAFGGQVCQPQIIGTFYEKK